MVEMQSEEDKVPDKVPAESSQPQENEKEKNKKKEKKSTKDPLDIESVAADLDVGIDIDAKFFEPIEASLNIESYDLTNEDLIKLIELHKQTNKKKLVLRITKKIIKLSFVDESVVDIEIPHHEVPRIWRPTHRGKLVLAIARNANLKYRIYFIQLERVKGQSFIDKLEVSYKEKLVEGAEAAKTTESGVVTSESKSNQPNESESQSPAEEAGKSDGEKPEEEKKTVSETPASAEVPASNLLDFSDEPDSSDTKDISFDSLLADVPAAPAPAASNPNSAILDLFSTPSTSSTAWANFSTPPVQETAKPVDMNPPSLFPPALAPPPGRASPGQRRAVSPQTAPTTPMPVGITNISSLSQPATPFAQPFSSTNLFAQPEPAPQRSASPFSSNGQQSLFPSSAATTSTNPFAQPTNNNAFQMNNLEAAFSQLRTPVPTYSAPPLQPMVVVENEKLIDNPFETSEPQQPEVSQAQVKNAFGDLLAEINFKPQTSQHASPKDMFAARDRKDKGPSLNDLSRN